MENKPASLLVEWDTPAFMWKTGGPDALDALIGPQNAMANHCSILPRKLHEHKVI